MVCPGAGRSGTVHSAHSAGLTATTLGALGTLPTGTWKVGAHHELLPQPSSDASDLLLYSWDVYDSNMNTTRYSRFTSPEISRSDK